MQRRDEDFLSRKLSDLKREVRGVKALDLSGAPDVPPLRAENKPSESERVVRYSMAKSVAQNGFSMRAMQTARPEAEMAAGEEYLAHEPYTSQMKPFASAHTPAARAAPAAAIFDQIYRKMDATPLQASVTVERQVPVRESFAYGSEPGDKHEQNLLSDLGEKLTQESAANQRLAADVAALHKNLEHERAKTASLEEQCRAELREAKARENEALAELAALERRAQELTQKTRSEEERTSRHRRELDELRRDNDLLRGELKRLGDLTGEKILELENGLNSVARMREFEQANFEMEKGNILNTGEFVMEQMRVKFLERGTKLEEQIRQASSERERLAAETRTLLEELRGFNGVADARINEIMSAVRSEQKAKHETELAEVNNRIRLEEGELAAAQQRHKDLLLRFQSVEREGKNRLIARKNENMRAKEELSAADQNYNKLLVQLNGEGKDLEKKASALAKLDAECQDIREKTEQLERRYAEEMQHIQADHAADVQELEAQLAAAKAEEQALIDGKREINARISEFQRRHNELIGELEASLNSTLNHHFALDAPGAKRLPSLGDYTL